MLFTRVAPHTKSKGLPISGLLLSKNLIFFTRVTPHIKSKGLPIGGPLLSKKLMLFTRFAPRTKSKGLPINGPLLSKKYAFYVCNTVYKKQGAPDRRSLTQQKIMLFTRVAPRTKSKGLPIDGLLLSKKLCFLHT
jgi:hypothetical protein